MADFHRIAEAGSVYDGDSIPVAVWGSRAHLEKQALATVSGFSLLDLLRIHE
jgi:hypothetical protein